LKHPTHPTPYNNSLPELKVKYYDLMVQYHLHHNNYLEVCRAQRALVEAEGVAEDPSKWQPALKRAAWFAVLAPSYSTAEGSGSDRASLVAATAADKRLADALPLYKQLLDTFTTPGALLFFWGGGVLLVSAGRHLSP
jgi:26S proteasome regulatory subunit N5